MGTLAGLVGGKAADGADALGAAGSRDPRAATLFDRAGATLDRLARRNEKLRRRVQWAGLVLVLVGAAFFAAARTDDRAAEGSGVTNSL